MHDEELYSIGDAAHRSGLSVTTVRFYADSGVIEPTATTEAGHRLYDIDAIARLELVRTLRDLDTGLEEIRRLLGGHTDLHALLTTHLEVVERQEHVLRARQAVLRALIKQGATTAQADLMHSLVSMPDEERERVIDDFWDEVSRELDVPPRFVERLRSMRPCLPPDPTAEQLQAWIELAELVRSQAFRDGVRSYLEELYSTREGRSIASDRVQDFIHSAGPGVGEELVAAYRSGEPVDSPRVRDAVARFVEENASFAGVEPNAQYRDRLATAFSVAGEFMGEEGAWADHTARYEQTHGRYRSLVSVINGITLEEEGLVSCVSWIATALRGAPRDSPAVATGGDV